MCYRPQLVNTLSGPRVCSCGHCLECKKARQNDVAHRLFIAGKSCPNVHFWTLTYSNEKLPLLVRPSKEYVEQHKLRTSCEFAYRSVEENFGYVAPELLVFDRFPRPSHHLGVAPREDGLGCDLIEVFYEPKYEHEMLFYDYDTCPSPFRTGALFDLQNGEILDDSSAFTWTYRRRLRKLYFKDYDYNHNRPVEYNGFTIAPTINNRDVQLWMKRFKGGEGHRNRFDFKYFYCGEYGPQTDRPHFHMITFGLTDSECAIMRDEWIKMYGNDDSKRKNLTNFSRVARIAPDGSDHLPRAARYVGKYVSKGTYESYLVRDGYSRAPHSCCSKGLWSITPEEFDWYTGADLLSDAVKQYVVSKAFAELDPRVAEFQVKNGLHRFLPSYYYDDDVLEQISDRLYYTMNGNEKYKYNLGKSFKNKLFKSINYENKLKRENRKWTNVVESLPSMGSDGRLKKDDGRLYFDASREEKTLYLPLSEHYAKRAESLVSTPLSLALSDFVSRSHLQDVSRAFERIKSETGLSKSADIIKQVKEIYEADYNDRKEIAKENTRKFLRNCKVL